MRNKFSLISVSTLLIGISVSSLSLAKTYICLDSSGQEKHRLQMSDDDKSGQIKRTKRAYFSGQREDETEYTFSLGQNFPFGKGSVCGTNPLFELTDTLTKSNLNCVLGTDYTYTAIISSPNTSVEKVLTIHTVASEKKVASKPKIKESGETHFCYQEDAIPFFYNYLSIITADGKGYFLEKALYHSSFKGMKELKFHVFDYGTQTQLAQVDAKDLITAVASGSTKAFDANAYKDNFDLRKINSANCWAGKSKVALSIENGKVQSESALLKGDIVEINGKVQIANTNTLTEAHAISGTTFVLKGYLCFGK